MQLIDKPRLIKFDLTWEIFIAKPVWLFLI